MRRPRVLVVDDDAFFCDLVTRHIELDVDVRIAHNRAEATALIAAASPPDLLVVDQQLPDGSGLELIPELHRINDNAKAIVVTGFPSLDSAVKAIKDGVYDYLTKPFALEDLRRTIANGLRRIELERVEQVAHYRRAADEADLAMVGVSAAWRAVIAAAEQAAESDAPVLITGESGSGKTLVARAIHYRSARRREAFLSINCGALPESLAEAELFGVERGAYTGANTTRKGLFELADGGTLLLDELGELSLASQAKLLGTVEDGLVRRLGGSHVHRTDVRLLSATNVAPAEAIAQHRLRRDLYYRLAVLHIEMPPLASRLADLPALCQYLLGKLAPGRAVHLAPGEIEALQAYRWAGNVRELRNVLERALLVDRGEVLRPSALLDRGGVSGAAPGASAAPAQAATAAPGATAADAATAATAAPGATAATAAPGATAATAAGGGAAPARTLAAIETEHLLRVFAAEGGNLTHTAAALDISLSTLRVKLRALGVPPGTVHRNSASAGIYAPEIGEPR